MAESLPDMPQPTADIPGGPSPSAQAELELEHMAKDLGFDLQAEVDRGADPKQALEKAMSRVWEQSPTDSVGEMIDSLSQKYQVQPPWQLDMPKLPSGQPSNRGSLLPGSQQVDPFHVALNDLTESLKRAKMPLNDRVDRSLEQRQKRDDILRDINGRRNLLGLPPIGPFDAPLPAPGNRIVSPNPLAGAPETPHTAQDQNRLAALQLMVAPSAMPDRSYSPEDIPIRQRTKDGRIIHKDPTDGRFTSDPRRTL